MKKKAHELVFISQIYRDGSGTKPVDSDYLEMMLESPICKDSDFDVHTLSLSEQTFIAFNFNAFVVKLKK